MTTYKKHEYRLAGYGGEFLQMLMGMVDSYLVASLGLIAISGVSVAGNIITIYQAIFIALGAAISSLISKTLAQGDKERLAYHTAEAIKLTLLLSLLLGLISCSLAGRCWTFWGRKRRWLKQAVYIWLWLVGLLFC